LLCGYYNQVNRKIQKQFACDSAAAMQLAIKRMSFGEGSKFQ